MYTDSGSLAPKAGVYETPCGRYSVERMGADRFEVYGPRGFIEWFVSPADAREFADGEASRNPLPTASRSRPR